MTRQVFALAAASFFFLSLYNASGSLAHTPLMACFDNGDDTITCGGGFSDGASAAGVPMRVENMDGNILLQGQMSEDDEFNFDKPKTDFIVIFDAGPNHIIREKGRDIVE